MHDELIKENQNNQQQLRELISLVETMNVISNNLYNQYNVKRGLRNADGTGVLAGLTTIGEVHGYVIDDSDKKPAEGKLYYRGIELTKLVKGFQKEKRFGFEETCYLILFGVLPTKAELEAFSQFLIKLRELPNNFIEDMILKAPSPNIMNKLARSILALYSYDESPDDIDVQNVLLQSMGLIAKFPLLIANAYAVKKHAYDKESLVIHTPNPNLGTAENFLYMIRPNHEYTRQEAEILDLCLTIHAEHGGGNNSAFTTHVVSSSGTDTYSAIAAAVGSLKGPKHGGAAYTVSKMFDEIKSNVRNWDDLEEIDKYLTKILNKQAFDKTGLIYGMGHAIYTLSDPRAVLLKKKAEKLAAAKGRSDEFKLYCTIEKMVPEIFAREKNSDKAICANVDFYSGFVYNMLGISDELYTPLFAMSRIVGWCAHRVEEIVSGGKIIRPAYKSVSKQKDYIPLKER